MDTIKRAPLVQLDPKAPGSAVERLQRAIGSIPYLGPVITPEILDARTPSGAGSRGAAPPTRPPPAARTETPAGQELRDLLAWVARGPRTYAATMAAWQTSCPRHSVWEDALGDDLVQVESSGRTPLGPAAVSLTRRGRATLDGA